MRDLLTPPHVLRSASRRATVAGLTLLLIGFLGGGIGGDLWASDPAAPPVASSTSASTGEPPAASAKEPGSLSVAPLRFPAYPEDRPAWIDQPPVLDGRQHLWPVASVPALTEAHSRTSLAEQIEVAVAAYVQHVTDSTVPPDQLGFDAAWIAAHLVDPADIYSGTVITSDGKMHEHAVQLAFDDAFRQLIQRRYSDLQVARRLEHLGLWGGGGLSLLLVLTGLLKVAHRRTVAPETDSQLAATRHIHSRCVDAPAADSRRSKLALFLAWGIVVGTIPAAAAAVWDIESIIVSGPLLVVPSVLLLILARRPPLRGLMPIGGTILIFALGCVLAIFGMDWSPREAQLPMGVAAVIFALLSQGYWPLLLQVVRRERRLPKAMPASTTSAQSAAPVSYAATNYDCAALSGK